MDLLDKLKMVRDEINLLIEAEEKKRGEQSQAGKTFQQRIGDMEMKKHLDVAAEVYMGRTIKIQDEL